MIPFCLSSSLYHHSSPLIALASSTTSTINMSPQPSTVLITGANRGEFNLDNLILYTSLAPSGLVIADDIFI